MEKILKEKIKEKLCKQAYINYLPEEAKPLAAGALAGASLGVAQPIYMRGLNFLGDIPNQKAMLPQIGRNLKYGIPAGIGAGALYSMYQNGMLDPNAMPFNARLY